MALVIIVRIVANVALVVPFNSYDGGDDNDDDNDDDGDDDDGGDDDG